MEMNTITAILLLLLTIVLVYMAYIIHRFSARNNKPEDKMEMERKIEELQQILSERDRQVAEMSASISNLSTEKEVQRTIAENSLLQLK